MKTHPRSLLAVVLGATFALTAVTARAEIPEPDHIVYGTPSWYGEPLAAGTVTLLVQGQAAPIASYRLGSEPLLGGMYALRVPLDAVDPRRPGSARSGERATILIDGTAAGTVVIGDRGTAQLVDVDPEGVVGLPAMSISDVVLAEGDAGSREAVFTVTLSEPYGDPVWVDWSTANGTAVGQAGSSCSGGDYLTGFGGLVIPNGNTSGTISVTVCSDETQEPDETFYVNLSSPDNAILLDPQGRGTILDDDTPPQLSVNNVTITEPSTGSVLATFRVSLSHTWSDPVGFHYQTALALGSGAASAGTDFLSTSGDGVIPAGALETTIEVEVLADTVNESDEIFYVDLSIPTNGTILDGRGQCTIVDAAQLLVFIEAEVNGVGGVSGLAGISDVAVSPGGEHVYAVGRSLDTLVLFDRAPDSGAATFRRAWSPADFGAGFVGLDAPEAVVVSADGGYVYVAAREGDAVSVFARNTDAGDPDNFGALTLIEVERNGVNDLLDAGGIVAGLDGPLDLALAPDGTSLYVAGGASHSLAVFARNTGTGRLSFVEAELDGFDDASDPGGVVDGLRQASSVAVSPDGETVYVAGPGDNAVAVFDRQLADGMVSFLEIEKDGSGAVQGLAGAVAVAVAPDGGHVLVAGEADNALTVFNRLPDGTLTYRTAFVHGIDGIAGLSAVKDVAFSFDGEYVYTAARVGNALSAFARDTSGPLYPSFGDLEQVEVKHDGIGGVEGLFGAESLAVSLDDQSVYVAGNLDNALVVFARDLLAPLNPVVTSPTHAVGVYSNLAVIGIRIEGADDGVGGSGVAGYSFVFDLSPVTMPDEVIDLEHGSDPHLTSSATLADGTSHWFHLRTCDHSRNCSGVVHLGPFAIDTVMPTGPTGVGSTSHEVGVPNVDDTIDMAWTAAVDGAPAPSGIAGYSYVFNGSSAPACNQEIDLPAGATGVTSASLADGVWYFHVCAADVAGNWAAPVTIGPFYVGSDTVPPRVTAFSSVAEPEAGPYAEGDSSPGGVTQLLLAFSELLNDPAGDVEIEDVTNPESYLLVEAGPDEVFQTTACGVPGGDDVPVTITTVAWDAASRRAALQSGIDVGYGRGIYRVVACADRLIDVNGNLLDGNGDGVGGDDAWRSFRIERENLLLNPTFDVDMLEWSESAELITGHSTEDARDAFSSGSAHIARSAGIGHDRELAVSQCVDLGVWAGEPLHLGARIRLDETGGGDPGSPTAQAEVLFFSALDCLGDPIGGAFSSGTVVDDTGGTWVRVAGDVAVPPVGAVSVLFSATVSIEPEEDFPFEAYFDDLLLAPTDVTPPTDPVVLSPSHLPNSWSNDTTVDVTWSGADDGVDGWGVKGYSFLFDQAAGTVPDPVLDLLHAADPHGGTSAALVDGLHYFHLRTCDWLNNCSSGTNFGPLGIDTLVPGPPSGVASTTHPLGGSSGANVIAMAWGSAADVGAEASGILGYAVEFTGSPTQFCDQTVDLAESAVSWASPPLPNGDWYFHICAADLAYNWSATVTLGPYTINDVTAPTVLNVASTGDTPVTPGSLDMGEEIGVPVTELRLLFSEIMADPPGDVGVDVTNPDGYLLVHSGPDTTLQTFDCAGPAGDDIQIPVDGVTWGVDELLATVDVGGGWGLPSGFHRLLACPAVLTDVTGNAVEAFALDFRIERDNLLENPNFDDGLTGWTGVPEAPSVFVHSLDDVDDIASSGSVLLDNESGPGAEHRLTQCVDLVGISGAVEMGGRVWIDHAVGATPPTASILLEFHDGVGCGGSVTGAISTPGIVGDTGADWLELLRTRIAVPAATQSALVTLLLEVEAVPPAEYTAAFDAVFFGPLDNFIFADGFEHGFLFWSGVSQ